MVSPFSFPSEVPASTPRAQRREELRLAINDVVETERRLASIAAERAVRIERVRMLSEADAAANAVEAEAAARDRRAWTVDVVARRELISELACALRIPERSAEALLIESRTLVCDLPATRAALESGGITYRHAQKLIDHAVSLPGSAVEQFEQEALPHAQELSVAKFDRRARIIRERMHPDSISKRTVSAREHRNVYLDPTRDGMAYLSAYLPAAVAVAGFNRIDDIATSLDTVDEPRTRAQLRADVFGDLLIDGFTDAVTMTPSIASFSADEIPVLAEQHLAELEEMGIQADLEELMADLRSDLDDRLSQQEREHASLEGIGRGIVARAMVTVPALTLLDRSEEPATLEGYGPIDLETARELAAGAPSLLRLLTHPESGAVLSVGRDSHPVPPDLRRWLRVRDDTCRFPGCGTAARRCDVDHTCDWELSGETCHDNLAHLCRSHHNLKHHTSWSYRHADAAGVLEFTAPSGRSYTTRPAVRFQALPATECAES